MEKLISGIHHITALAEEPQRNIDFYTGVLGLRLVKKTVNFDAPQIYHLYYGNETGAPGTLLTFFPYEGIKRGRRGSRMITSTGFSAPYYSISYWEYRLKRFKIAFTKPAVRFEKETVIYFEDPDGMGLELVFNDHDPRSAFTYGNIPLEHSIKGFYHAEIWAHEPELTADLLTGKMDHRLMAVENNRYRYASTDQPGCFIDIVHMTDKPEGIMGGGSVHHIAFNTANRQTQETMRSKISESMLNPTPVIDRNYFTSIYFREPGGVLFEIATTGPGVEIDEPREKLGESFMLPLQYEPYRNDLEKMMKPLKLNLNNYI